MFWKGRVTGWNHLQAWWRDDPVTFATELEKPSLQLLNSTDCRIKVATYELAGQIAKLLNEWFEPRHSRAKMTMTPEWVRRSYLEQHAIWIVACDRGGTVRGCIGSFFVRPPYPNSLAGCGLQRAWGVMDFYCVHPLWRSKGIGSALLEMIDYITYSIGRKAHVFLKEGVPLAPPQMPIYGTMWWWRKAGTSTVKTMRDDSGLRVHLFHCEDKVTHLPMVRVEGLREKDTTVDEIAEWESALDVELPECLVFVTSADKRDDTNGWQWDSPVWMYAFRWNVGRWLGEKPTAEVL